MAQYADDIREKRYFELLKERDASWPGAQFSFQYDAETERLWHELPGARGDRPIAMMGPHAVAAYENIKRSWIEQGIWRSEWEGECGIETGWKHEEPLEVESESEEEQPASIFFPARARRQPKSDEERRKIAERRAVRERERNASRPRYQFLYQVSKHREQIENELKTEEGQVNTDIDTRAYEDVKSSWVKHRIWDNRWSRTPGMSWKHEEPLEKQLGIDRIHMQNSQPMDLFIKQETPGNTLGSATEEPNHLDQSSGMNDTRQVTRQEVVSSIIDNHHVDQSLCTSSSSHSGDYIPQKLVLGHREQSPSRGSPSTMNASLSSGHSMMSKSSKTSLLPQQLKRLHDDGAQPLSNVAVKESQTLVECECQRESRRSKDRQTSSTDTTSTGSFSKQAVPQKPRWVTARKFARAIRKVCNKAKKDEIDRVWLVQLANGIRTA